MEFNLVNNHDLNRRFYLDHFWTAYPEVVLSEKGLCGRLVTSPVNITDNFFEFTDDLEQRVLQKIDLTHAGWFIDSKVNQKSTEVKVDAEQDLKYAPRYVLKPGDWIQLWPSAKGRTNIGTESSSEIKSVLLLSPCLAQKALVIKKQKLYRQWVSYLAQIRQFFIEHNFDEIKSPTLVVCPGTEPFLEPFVTEFKFGNATQKYFLPTSPELSLKKCLARGWRQIFEIRPCFRNSERSALHLSEFYMLEWYRSFNNLEIIKQDICALLASLKFPGWDKSKLFSLSMAELFQRYLNFDLKPNTTASELYELSIKYGLDAKLTWDFDDLFYLLYVEKIEPKLAEFEFLFLEKYPPSQAALARLTKDGWGDRFEFYINGVEIANAFHELNDPNLQRQRFEEDLAKKRKYHKTDIPIDEEFLLHLEQGMPPSAGIALGLERLFMMAHEIQDINDITSY